MAAAFIILFANLVFLLFVGEKVNKIIPCQWPNNDILS
jgi:hypothetical protein